MPLKLFLPLYLAAYFFAAFFWRSYLVWKRTKVNPLVLGTTDSAHDYIGRVFKILFGAVVTTSTLFPAS